jgi:hypothetical protein
MYSYPKYRLQPQIQGYGADETEKNSVTCSSF